MWTFDHDHEDRILRRMIIRACHCLLPWSVCALQELSFVSSTSEARLFFLPRTDHHVPGDHDGDHDGDGDEQAGLKPGRWNVGNLTWKIILAPEASVPQHYDNYIQGNQLNEESRPLSAPFLFRTSEFSQSRGGETIQLLEYQTDMRRCNFDKPSSLLRPYIADTSTLLT